MQWTTMAMAAMAARAAMTVVAAAATAACTGQVGGADAGRADAAPAGCAAIGDRPVACPPRGVYRAPVTVELAARDPSWPIHYTLDGSAPTAASPRYQAPLIVDASSAIAGVVRLRAVALPPDAPPAAIAHSYVFPERVLDQPADPAGFPAQWGVHDITAADYAMDATVLDGARDDAADALAHTPTLVVWTAPGDVFGPDGIYMNPEREGDEWERAAAIEFLFPDGATSFIEGGIRVQGGSSTTNWKSRKLSLRLVFRQIYGPGELDLAAFADSPVDEFETLVLDAHLNLTWTHPDHAQRIRSQYVRDIFVSDLQNAVGSLAPHGRFFHLYLNGLYWGLYDVHERPDEAFAAAHLGGARDDYDVLRHTGAEVVYGDAAAWDAMFAIARAGLADPANYEAIGGYLDVGDFIDYMLVNFYAGNDDWPHHNWYAARRRADGAGFRFFSWDAEHVLKDVDVNVTGESDANTPGELFQTLRANDAFRAQLAARAAELFGAGGPLSPEQAAARYGARADEVAASIRLESARWGDTQRPGEPYTVADWQAELDWLLNEYFPQRSAVVTSQISGL